MATLTVQQILDAGLDDWRLLSRALHSRYRTGSFVTGLAFVTAVTDAAEAANHHPDVTLTYPHVDLALLSHDVGHVTQRDLDLARQISRIAHDHGIASDPGALAECELALDTADLAALGPFWAVLLTGGADHLDGDEITDPGGRVPLLWFQGTDGPDDGHADEVPRQRFHLDLWLPHDVAQPRIEAAVAAGGSVVSDAGAPSFTVLADADGNRVCVCTCLERS